jgi:hypothetical protein
VTGATPFPVVISETANCPTVNNAPNATNTATQEPRMNQGQRWSYIGTNPILVAVRVHVVGVRYKVTVSETTLFNSSWSTSGGFATQWGLQNTTGNTITGTLTVQESVGGTASYTRTISLPANRTTFVTTYDQFNASTIPAGRGGSATFAHLRAVQSHARKRPLSVGAECQEGEPGRGRPGPRGVSRPARRRYWRVLGADEPFRSSVRAALSKLVMP